MSYGKSTRGTPDEITHRRSLIKQMILEEGITNREEIRRRLEAEGISVSRNTIYSDFKKVATISREELKEFELDIMGIFKKMIRQLEYMIETEEDYSKKATLIRALSTVIKDRHQVASNIAMHGKPESKARRKQEQEEVNISFG